MEPSIINSEKAFYSSLAVCAFNPCFFSNTPSQTPYSLLLNIMVYALLLLYIWVIPGSKLGQYLLSQHETFMYLLFICRQM